MTYLFGPDFKNSKSRQAIIILIENSIDKNEMFFVEVLIEREALVSNYFA